jgi:hypothetical protein
MVQEIEEINEACNKVYDCAAACRCDHLMVTGFYDYFKDDMGNYHMEVLLLLLFTGSCLLCSSSDHVAP